MATVKQQNGRIDVLFANAGVYGNAALGSVTEEHFDKLFDINVKGLLFTVQKALPLMSKGGSILLTGSVAGSKGIPAGSVYGATKAAVRLFARTWMLELKDRGIRVNVISPGPIETPMAGEVPKELMQEFIKQVPMGRMGTAAEVANAAVFLASDDSSFVTGTELLVDGGSAEL
jgi:NAD(P)-dependent dehydrogenase (short-subunit alcohol dehydrogenase family)